VIVIDHAAKTFVTRGGDEVVALSDISLEVARNEFVCLVGPSGCGKSTLLNIIAGLEPPSSGTVLVNGIVVEGAGADRGMVFQEAALFPWLNVLSNVEFPLRRLGIARAERRERAQHYLRMVHLSRFADSYVHELSGGMRQRVAIARALVMDPSVLLMDEPFAALDAQNRVILQGELVRLWEQTGKTVIYVTHSIEEALLMGDRTVIMTAQPGRIKRIIDVPFPHPRDLLQLSASAEFGALKLDIWRVLEEEVTRARAEAEQ